MRKRLQKIKQAEAQAEKAAASLSDEAFVKAAAWRLHNLEEAIRHTYFTRKVWRVWWDEAAKRDLLTAIMDEKRKQFGLAWSEDYYGKN